MNEIDKKSYEAIKKAVKIAGGQNALAKLCGNKFKQNTVWDWLNKTKKVSPKFVVTVEKGVNAAVTRHELRGDIFPIDD